MGGQIIKGPEYFLLRSEILKSSECNGTGPTPFPTDRHYCYNYPAKWITMWRKNTAVSSGVDMGQPTFLYGIAYLHLALPFQS